MNDFCIYPCFLLLFVKKLRRDWVHKTYQFIRDSTNRQNGRESKQNSPKTSKERSFDHYNSYNFPDQILHKMEIKEQKPIHVQKKKKKKEKVK